ncbi:CGNR zinc finger domain-containing protein [Geomicrobium sp. JCM 19055]|uniref:CGNR zinc finger domain-containing protein n=1 Tax=Geomicrobium sp. JCM 19055 TaxID=1460649 RepID=UPI0009DF78E5
MKIKSLKYIGFLQSLIGIHSFQKLLCLFPCYLLKTNIKKIKFCQNEDCRWVFYDNTKNGRKQWCTNDTCGNLLRVRKHRHSN